MNNMNFTSLFSGGGGFDLGAIAAGLNHAWGLEYDPRIAEVYRENIGPCHNLNILDADPMKFEKIDWLHASPVCKSFSPANKNKGELQLDIDCAKKVSDFIETLQPKYFSLENVEAYRRSRSFNLIVDTLNRLGYWVNWQVLNAADFGVPQSRRRLILLAIKGGFLPPLPLKEKHRGWYEAISDLVYDLPDSPLAIWQEKLLPDTFKNLLIHPTDQRTMPVIDGDVPSFTITTNQGGNKIKAFLVESTGARSDRPLQIRESDEPCWTIRAMGKDGHWHRSNALLENSRTVALNIRCNARLQSFPDDYRFPDENALAGVIIGNSVPPLMSEKLVGNVLQFS